MMFGLTLEKLVLVAVIAAIILGPHRLPDYAHRLARWIAAARSAVDGARARTEIETGISLRADDWQALDPRRYDPRRIVREALVGGAATGIRRDETATGDSADGAGGPVGVVGSGGSADGAGGTAVSDDPGAPVASDSVSAAPGVPGVPAYVVTGSSGHPRRRRVVDPAPVLPAVVPAGSEGTGDAAGRSDAVPHAADADRALSLSQSHALLPAHAG